MPLVLGANSVSGYNVANSLRFNSGSSDFLNRTQGTSTAQTKATISFWFKRSILGTTQRIFEGYTAATDAGNGQIEIYGDQIVFGGYNTDLRKPTQLFRDVSAWYHLIVACDTTLATANDRVKIYLNGSEITAFDTSNNPTQNSTLGINNNSAVLQIGRRRIGSSNDNFFNGYLSEFYFIDGQQLTPSSFGETDTLSGIWKPKAYTGTFGNNGFYLQFKNSASLGTDSSGNGNTWTVNNLTSIDQTTDTPTNNFCTMNFVDNLAGSGSGTLTQGNTNVTYTGGDFKTNATIAPNKAKWYWESKAVANTRQGTIGMRIGFQEIPNTFSVTGMVENASFGMLAHPSAGVYSVVNGSNVLRSASLTYVDGDIIGIALDLDNNISYWYKNGTLSVTYDFSALSTINSKNIAPTFGNGSGSSSPEINANFGNPSITIASGNADGEGFGNFEYAVPAGYFALCSKNLAKYG